MSTRSCSHWRRQRGIGSSRYSSLEISSWFVRTPSKGCSPERVTSRGSPVDGNGRESEVTRPYHLSEVLTKTTFWIARTLCTEQATTGSLAVNEAAVLPTSDPSATVRTETRWDSPEGSTAPVLRIRSEHRRASGKPCQGTFLPGSPSGRRRGEFHRRPDHIKSSVPVSCGLRWDSHVLHRRG